MKAKATMLLKIKAWKTAEMTKAAMLMKTNGLIS
jgi:hypothetical protein